MSATNEAVDVRQNILDAAQNLMAVKGFSAVGLNEILAVASVPKGSFYHYFGSKDAFGDALLKSYFEDYHADLDVIFSNESMTCAERILVYFQRWRSSQSDLDCKGRCLAVKLAAEVSDLSEAMRLALKEGTAGVVNRLSDAIEAGVADGSVTIKGDAHANAEALYFTWLGASLMVKIVRSPEAFESAMATTRMTLRIPNQTNS